MKPVTFHPFIQRDISDALRRYEDISERLADEIWEEFQLALTKIQKNPKQHKDEHTGLCRLNLNQFPYNILFVEYSNKIRIQVFRHNSRKVTFGSYRK
jgi:hypothetical protein